MQKLKSTAMILMIAAGCAHININTHTYGRTREVNGCVFTTEPETPQDYICNARILAIRDLHEQAVRVIIAGMVRFGETREFLLNLAKVLSEAGMKEEAEIYMKRAEMADEEGK